MTQHKPQKRETASELNTGRESDIHIGKTDSQKQARPHMLIYAHYYYPDVASTGQILKDLAEDLLDTFEITVICAVPSYGGTVTNAYTTSHFYEEELNGVHVIRVRVSEFNKSDRRTRLRNIADYFIGALTATFKVKEADYVFSITQPPIIGGLTGVWGKWTRKGRNGKRARFIYNIQDFNPEQTMAVGYIHNRMLLRIMMCLDKFSCRQSDLVITVGRDLVETLVKRFHNHNVPKYTVINNWTDEKGIYPLPPHHEEVEAFRNQYGLSDSEGRHKFVIMYSGNIGLYYDLINLVRVMKHFRKGFTQNGVYESGPMTPDGREVVFAFVGGGSELERLKEYSKRHRFENLVFIPYQGRDKLIFSLNAGDVHWCVNAKGIKGVSCPSKCYGIMAAGKPVLGVLEKGTEIRMLIEDSGCGRCCEPGGYDEIAEQIQWFIDKAGSDLLDRMGISGRKYLVEKLAREISINKYKKAISNL